MPRQGDYDEFDDDEYGHSHRSHHTMKCGDGHGKAAVAVIAAIVAATIIGLGFASLQYNITFDKILNPSPNALDNNNNDKVVVVSDDNGDGSGDGGDKQKQSQAVEIKIIDGKAKIKHKSD